MGHVKTPRTNNDVATPLVTIIASKIGVANAVSTGNGPRSAASGEKLVAARIAFDQGPLRAAYRPDSIYHQEDILDAEPTYKLQVDGRQRDVSFPDTDGPHTLVASVPKESDPKLLVTVDGRTQALSLTSGQRVSTNAKAFYRQHRTVQLGNSYPAANLTDGDFDVTHSIRFTDARLMAFHPTLGWPDKGKSWLVVNTDQRRYDWNDLYSIRIDRAKTASVVDGAGHVSTDVTQSRERSFFIPSELIQLVFQVDQGQDSFQLTYRPTIAFRSQGPGPDPGSGTVQLQPLTFPINLSGG